VRKFTESTIELCEYLEWEFGRMCECPLEHCPFVTPPVGIPFEVFEPLQSDKENGFIPRGFYEGIEEPGILAPAGYHKFHIKGSLRHETNNIRIRISLKQQIDWRGVRAVK
jgi:hypothetical protein